MVQLPTNQLRLLVKCLKEDSEKGPIFINPDISIQAFEELIELREKVKRLEDDFELMYEFKCISPVPLRNILYDLGISPEDL